MNDQILAAFARYGSPALFAIVAVAAIGLPLPVTLLLIVTGSMVAQGAMDAWSAIAIAAAGSVAGDQIGFAIGRWGGTLVIQRLKHLLGDAKRLRDLDAKAKTWGTAGVFFSRWLVTPLGPWINLASGASRYSWLRFTIWDVIGETVGAALYVWVGIVFNDRVQEVGAVLGDLTWAIVAVLLAAVFGWRLLARRSVEAKAAQSFRA